MRLSGEFSRRPRDPLGERHGTPLFEPLMDRGAQRLGLLGAAGLRQEAGDVLGGGDLGLGVARLVLGNDHARLGEAVGGSGPVGSGAG